MELSEKGAIQKAVVVYPLHRFVSSDLCTVSTQNLVCATHEVLYEFLLFFIAVAREYLYHK